MKHFKPSITLLSLILMAGPAFADVKPGTRKLAQESTSTGAGLTEEQLAALAQVADQQLAAGKEKTDAEKKADELSQLKCENESELHERALCMLGNFDSVKEKSADLSLTKKERDQYSRVLRDIRTKTKQAMADAFAAVESQADISEARSKFKEIADLVQDTGDRDLKSAVRSMRPRLEKMAQERIQTDRWNKVYEDRTLPALEAAADRYEWAKDSGNIMMEYQAKREYEAALYEAKNLMKIMGRFNPESDITFMGRTASGVDFSQWQENFDQTYASIETSLSEFGVLLGNSNNPMASNLDFKFGAGRQQRNPMYSPITTMPTYGSNADLYGNSLIRDNGVYFDNNSMSASQWLTQNPGLAAGRGRG